MTLTVALFVCMDTIGKFLVQTYPVLQVTWARFFFHALALALVLRGRVLYTARSRQTLLQVGRGALMLSANLLFIAGVTVLPLISANAVLLVSPLLVTALAVPLLGEHVGVRRWTCVGAGLCGALIIIRPGFSVFQWASLFPLGAACCFALYQIATRQVSRHDTAMTSLFYTVSVGAPVTTLLMPFVWVTPDLKAWILMCGMGLIGGISHFTLIKAFTVAPAAVVSPFNYTNLVWATLLGFLVFNELPDRWTLLGAVIICTSGLYAFFREHKLRATRTLEG